MTRKYLKNIIKSSYRTYLYIKTRYFASPYLNRKIFACAIMKNEAPYLLEWIAYHRTIGIDHFLIYENESTDNTKEILKRLHDSGVITYIDWPNKVDYDKGPQIAAYRDACNMLKGKCEWVAFIDTDEFIVSNQYDNIHDFLSAYRDVDALAINWKTFGSAGKRKKDNGLVIERFTKCCAQDNKKGCRNFKTIAKLDFIDEILTPHRVRLLNNYYYRYPDREIVGNQLSHIDHTKIQINHYRTKSKEEWDMRKARGGAYQDRIKKNRLFDRSEDPFREWDLNEDEDRQILRFLDKTKKEIESLQRILEDV